MHLKRDAAEDHSKS